MKVKSNNKIGVRIKKIRVDAGLRQRELAVLLGTTQSAVYKHEHGAIPGPDRLLKLAKLGNTTIEWILTGRHWENGSSEKDRLDADILSLAKAFRKIDDEKRKIYREAIDILEETMTALEKKLNQNTDEIEQTKIAEAIRELPKDVLDVLSASSEIHRAIRKHILSRQKTQLSKITTKKNKSQAEASAKRLITN